uniref:Uncharacterized protein n=1 Tax=Tanacetum cinerariifolium TaxID=118510 RepID=A0A699RA49_TANCI|nr:hypothetical protein [Tanacetum cinerariifolium]
MPTPSPSPLASLSPPSTGERLARCTALVTLSPPLPPPLHMPPHVDHSQRVDLLMKDKIAHQGTIQIIEDEAYVAREAWAYSIGLSQGVHYELQTHQAGVCTRVSALDTPDTATVAEYSHSDTTLVT